MEAVGAASPRALAMAIAPAPPPPTTRQVSLLQIHSAALHDNPLAPSAASPSKGGGSGGGGGGGAGGGGGGIVPRGITQATVHGMAMSPPVVRSERSAAEEETPQAEASEAIAPLFPTGLLAPLPGGQLAPSVAEESER